MAMVATAEVQAQGRVDDANVGDIVVTGRRSVETPP